MFLKHLIFVTAFILCFNFISYSQQRIKNFYFSNYKKNGTKGWEIKGEEAVIFGDYVDIRKMEANYYLEEDTIFIESKKAKLDKNSLDVFLKDDVLVKNKKEEIELITDSLNWRRRQNKIQTADFVKAQKEDMQIEAKGLVADTQFKKVNFKEDVKVKFSQKEDAITISCQGPLEIEHDEQKAVFYNKVIVESKQGKLFCDKSTIFFDTENNRIKKIISEGNVKIIREENVIFAKKATYLGEENKLVLEGNPRVIYFPKENETFGN
ncbi:MAG TPA: LPS export ABC transporter periplasmic protein LptC [Candidatus Omnitrophica bacterium]|nr:LPS export ABC transporter periplasmic protein LptC [Candidatus Omnitrophota bacterium]